MAASPEQVLESLHKEIENCYIKRSSPDDLDKEQFATVINGLPNLVLPVAFFTVPYHPIPLHHAVTRDTYDKTIGLALVKKLLELGADPNQQDRDGYTALHYAATGDICSGPNIEILKVLSGQGNANIDVKNNQGRTPLHHAVMGTICKDVSIAAVRTLIDCGADISVKDNKGKTPLDYATESNNAEIIKLLGEQGAKPTSPCAFFKSSSSNSAPADASPHRLNFSFISSGSNKS